MRSLGVRRLSIGDWQLQLGGIPAESGRAAALAPTLSDAELKARRRAKVRREEALEFAHVEGLPPDMDLESFVEDDDA